MNWTFIRHATKITSTFDASCPFFIGERRSVQLRSARAPIVHESVHQSRESFTMASFEVVRHLMDHDVLQAVGVLFGEFDVEPDVSAFPVARSPFGFHASDTPARYRDL